MTLGEYQEVFTINVGKLINYSEMLGFRPRMRECQRTAAQQEIYIKEGKSRTKNSAHLDSLAVDLYFTKDGKLLANKVDLQILGEYWESLYPHNQWGGNWTKQDCPHFELRRP